MSFPKPKKSISLILFPLILVSVLILVFIFNCLIIIRKVTGSDNSIFKNGQNYYAEKITYIFKNPKVGDSVMFTVPSVKDMDYIGVISEISDCKQINECSFIITNRKNSTNPWKVNRKNIKAKIYYPMIEN